MLHSRLIVVLCGGFFLFKQKTAYEVRISDWSSDVCSSDLDRDGTVDRHGLLAVQKLLPVDPIFGFALPKAGVSENNRQGRKRHEAFLVNEGQVKIGRASCRERVCQYV